MAAWVLGTFRDRSALTMTTLYKSMVRSKLEYCCPVWDPPKITDIQAIETVQRQFTRRISGLKDLDYWERLKKLKIMSLQRRRERYSIIQVWKILNGLSPNSTDMKFDNSDRLGVRAKLPSFNHKAQTSVSSAYDSSFGVNCQGPPPVESSPQKCEHSYHTRGIQCCLGSWEDSLTSSWIDHRYRDTPHAWSTVGELEEVPDADA